MEAALAPNLRKPPVAMLVAPDWLTLTAAPEASSESVLITPAGPEADAVRRTLVPGKKEEEYSPGKSGTTPWAVSYLAKSVPLIVTHPATVAESTPPPMSSWLVVPAAGADRASVAPAA